MPSKERILIINNNDSFTFNLVQMIEESGSASFDVVGSDMLDGEIVNRSDKILISPGPGLPADFPGMCRIIQQYGSEKNILGICLGMQAIAVEFGGKLINLSRVNHGVTTSLEVVVSNELLFNGVTNGSKVGLYHSWTIDPDSIPECLEITAISKEQTILAIRHRQYNVRGVQFHPESFMTPSGRKMIYNWLTNT